MITRSAPRRGLAAVLLIGVSAAMSLGASARAHGPEEDVPRYDARTFYDTESVFGGSFSHDEARILLTSDASGVFNVYSQPIDGGERTQLTHSEGDAFMGLSWFPNDDRFLYTADQGGNELNHVYVQTPDGTTRDLTPGEGLKAQFGGWTFDLTGFYVLTNERDNRFFDLYRYSATDYSRELLHQSDSGMSFAGISRDARWIALAKIRNNADDDIYVIDRHAETPEPRLMTEHEGNVSHGVQSFAPNSELLMYTSDAGSEFARLWACDLESGERTVVDSADWDIGSVGYSYDGRYRVTSVNADARTRIRVQDLKTGQPLDLPTFPSGDIAGLGFSRSGEFMTFTVNGPRSPSNVYLLKLPSGTPVALTDTLNPAIDSAHLVDAEVIRYPSFDGLEIPAVLYRPHQATATSKVPAIVFVHGGPGGQSRTGYSALIQYLCNHGYAVLAVNNRGSSGYGKTFFHLDDLRHGEDDLQDCIHGRRYLERQDWVDGSRVGIMGGSYGGYMVAAALAFEPEAFDVGVDIFGVTNWLRTLESIPPWWSDFREALYAELGDPATDRERLERISPLFHATNITRPLLVVQGANDPRVLQAESDEIVAVVRENGVPVEYLLFPDEGHGFRNRVNRVSAAEAYRDFLDRYLN